MNNKLRVADEVVLDNNQFTFINREKIRILKTIFVMSNFMNLINKEVL